MSWLKGLAIYLSFHKKTKKSLLYFEWESGTMYCVVEFCFRGIMICQQCKFKNF